MAARPSFDLSDVELSPETRALLPLEGGEAPLAQQRRFGTWWVAPFGRTADGDLVGFRLVPGVGIVDCPVVWASGPAVVTVASNADRVVPAIVFTQMLSAPRRWVEAAELLDSEWDELDAAHRALGGVDGLAELRRVAADEALRAACEQSVSGRNAAAATIFERLDPSAETTVFRTAWLAAAEGRPLPAATNAGCWTAAVGALPERNRALQGSLAAAWRLFQRPSGLDVAWLEPGNPWPAPVATEVARRLFEAARLLKGNERSVPFAWRRDPLWPALAALAAAASPFDYRGVEFMEAAAALDERDEGERALDALTAVELWSFLAGDPTQDACVEAAHALATRRRWPHLVSITNAVLTP